METLGQGPVEDICTRIDTWASLTYNYVRHMILQKEGYSIKNIGALYFKLNKLQVIIVKAKHNFL